MTALTASVRPSLPPRLRAASRCLAVAFALALPLGDAPVQAEDPTSESPSETASETVSETAPEIGEWTDARIEQAIRDGCDPGHKLRHYRGGYRDFDVLGPLYLAEHDDGRARGVVLPTYLRLSLYGFHRRCQRIDLDEARTLAGPDTWVVLWRTEEPFRGRQSMTDHDQRILRPKEVRLRHDDAWHDPAETRGRDPWINRWFFDDWDPEESLVAVFDDLPRAGSLFVDYDVEEDGRSYLTESSIFSMHSMPESWWALAHGEQTPKGGPWWKR